MRRWLLLLIVTVVQAGAGYGTTAGSVQKQPEKVVLQLKWKHQFQFAGYYAAIEQGYYREAGIEVELREAPASGNPVMEVVRGKADFGIAASDLLLLRSSGYPVVALAAVFQHSPLILLARRSGGLQSIHDLAGKRVSFENHADELRAYLKVESVPMTTLELVPHRYSPAELIQGKVDAITAYSTDEPFLLRKAGVRFLEFTPRSAGIDFYGDTLFTMEKTARTRRSLIGRFLRASRRGWEYALKHPEKTVDLILKKYSTRHSREHLLFEAAQTRRLVLPDLVHIGYMHTGRWRHIADTYASLGMLPAGYNLDGFVFDMDRQQGLGWVYTVLAGVVLLALAVAAVAVRFYRMNRLIREENLHRRKVEERLKGLQERYRLLVENAPFPIVISLLDGGRVLFMNPAAASLFQIDRNYGIGKYTREFYADPEVRPEVLRRIHSQGYLDRFQLELLDSTGGRFWAELSARVIRYEGQDALFLAIQNISPQKKLEEELIRRAGTDELTGLWNRRRFLEAGQELLRQAVRSGNRLSLLMIDLDHFKQINDSFGHAAGDAVLQRFSRLLEQEMREGDAAGRLGGEEFAVLLPGTDGGKGAVVAERIRSAVEREVFPGEGRMIRVTVSIGVAGSLHPDAGLDDLLRDADGALYRAKRDGRNRVEVQR